MNKWTGVLLAAVIVCVAAQAPAQEKSEYKFGLHFSSSSGMSSSQQFDFVNLLLKPAGEKYGYNIKIIKFSSTDDVKLAFVENKIDAAALFPGEVAEIIVENDGVYPWASFAVKKRRKEAECLWQRKSDESKDISGVIGKTLLRDSLNLFPLIQLREYLAENGIDKPLWRVFKSFIIVPTQNSSYLALAMGDGDFLFSTDDGEVFLKLINPNVASKLTNKLCTERIYARGAIMFNKNTISESDFKGLKTFFKKGINDFNEPTKKRPEADALKQYMKLASTKFFAVEADYFDSEVKLYRKAKKNGWFDEALFVTEKLKDVPMGKPIEIKLDYKMCKEKCAGAGNQLACVEECME